MSQQYFYMQHDASIGEQKVKKFHTVFESEGARTFRIAKKTYKYISLIFPEFQLFILFLLKCHLVFVTNKQISNEVFKLSKTLINLDANVTLCLSQKSLRGERLYILSRNEVFLTSKILFQNIVEVDSPQESRNRKEYVPGTEQLYNLMKTLKVTEECMEKKNDKNVADENSHSIFVLPTASTAYISKEILNCQVGSVTSVGTE